MAHHADDAAGAAPPLLVVQLPAVRGDGAAATVAYSPPLCVACDRRAGHGGMLWDGALALSHYVWQTATVPAAAAPQLPRHLRVLEIGAGTGLPAAAAAAALPHATVVATDLPALVPLLRGNCALNAAAAAAAGSVLTAAPHTWGGSFKRLASDTGSRAPYDLLLAADVVGVGEGAHSGALVKTLCDAAAANPLLLVLLAHRSRDDGEGAFFAGLAAASWTVRTVATYPRAALAALHACVRVAVPAGAPLPALLPADDLLEHFAHSDVDILLLSPPLC